MEKLFKIKRNRSLSAQSGMSYVELIVVLSIFSTLSSVVIFNYGDFQSRIDIKNLASDIALKIVEAQKSSLSGFLPPLSQQTQISSTWKPSYGVYINKVTDNKSFIYFTDLNLQNHLYDTSSCPGTGECLEKFSITKENSISSLNVFYIDGSNVSLNDLTFTFSRPNSSPTIKSSTVLNSGIDYVQITVISPKGVTAMIKLYASGRVQVN
ncbi:MAG: type II secretion system protein [Candidatus Paceibacterota bacterium]